MRTFAFRNAAGNLFDLTGGRGVYLTEPAGLGIQLSPAFADLTRGFFTPVSEETEPQSTITGTLIFTASAYATYQVLCNWIFAAGSLSLVYSPIPGVTYYRDVTINFLQKGELDRLRWLHCPLSLFATTPWYRPQPFVADMESGTADTNKRYDYVYTRQLQYGTDASGSMSALIQPAGHVPGALDVRYHGPITNPRIRLSGRVTGRALGLCRITATFAQGDTFLYSSRYNDAYVRKKAPDGTVTDMLDALDLSTSPFVHPPADEPCIVSIEADSAIVGTAEILAYYYYRSV